MKTIIRIFTLAVLLILGACQKYDSVQDSDNTAIKNSSPLKASFEVESKTLDAQLISENNLTPIHDHASVVFKDKIWIIGGHTDGEASNTIMNSSDGVKWKTVKTRSVFSPRRGHTVVVFQNKLWVIGGSPTDEYGLFILDIEMFGEVWSSSDGVTWEKINQGGVGYDSVLHGRYNHSATVFNGEIWLFGGTPDNYWASEFRNVQKSSDGIHWKTVTTLCFCYAGIGDNTSVVFDNKLWVVSGHNNGKSLFIKSTSDGVNWESHDTSIPGYYQHQLITDNKQMYLVGGKIVPNHNWDSAKLTNHIWHTKNGDEWFKVKASPNFPKRQRHSSVYYNQKFWVIGGSDNEYPLPNAMSDVWALTPLDPYTVDDLTFE